MKSFDRASGWKIASLTVCSVLLATSLAHSHPNPDRPAAWSTWLPNTAMLQADFDAGFSNTELGGYMDFSAACSLQSKQLKTQPSYQFRLSRLVEQIGTGKVEYGCWANDRLLMTFTSTAVRPSLGAVSCLQVKAPQGQLVIRSEPRLHAARVGVVKNGETVQPTAFPAELVETEGQNWLAIATPAAGWVLADRPDGQSLLGQCAP